MGGRGVVAIITWVVATLIVVSLAWVAVSHAVAGIADPIPNIMGHGKRGARGALVPARNDAGTIHLSPGAASAVGSTTTVPAGAATAVSTTGKPSFAGAVDGAAGTHQQDAPGSPGPAPPGGQSAGTGNAALPGIPGSAATARASGHTAGGTNGPQPGAGVAVPVPAPTTTAPSTVKSFGSPGGTVSVRCTGDSITLVSATPQSGYSTDLGDPGPDQVNINFASSAHEYDMQVVCQGGIPAGSVDD